MDFKGTIIEESLKNRDVLKDVKILSTEIEKVTEEFQTPWLSQWTLHIVEIPEDKAEKIAVQISKSLDLDHNSSWYADFKNETYHYIIFNDKIFKVNRSNPKEYEDVTKYGVSLGIPDHQLNFSADIK